MDAYKLGFIVGIIVGCILVAVFVVITRTKRRKDGKMRCDFDERQEIVRGRGFKYGFFTLLLTNLFSGFYFEIAETGITDAFTFCVFTCCVGICVYAVYCIWNDAYFALNESRNRLLAVFAFTFICNLLTGIRNLLTYEEEEAFGQAINGRGNLIISVMLFVIFLTLLLKKRKDKKESEE